MREKELDLLSCFITKEPLCSSPNLVVQGYKSVGKTYTVLNYLHELGIKKSIVNCDECITQKILLQRCLMSIMAESGKEYDASNFMYKGLKAARTSVLCENFAYFLMSLEQFIVATGYNEPHVLVLDRFDQCCDPTDDLFSAFVRLQEHSVIRNISVIYITSHDDPREISTLSVPHIHFGPYSQDQLVEILQAKHSFHLNDVSPDEDVAFWRNFTKLIVDLFYDYTGSDLLLLSDLCHNLWHKFANPVNNGRYKPSEFLRLFRDIRDQIFNDSIVSNSCITDYITKTEEVPSNVSPVADLPYHSKFLLIASYLASYVDPKSDLNVFSRMKTLKKRKERKTTESSISKKNINSRLLSASFFDLERLKAILSVIYRNESKSLSQDNQEYLNLYQDLTERELAKKDNEFATFTLNTTVDVNTQLSTLVSLGLINRTYASDILSSKIRWKCNVGWDIIESLAREISFPIENYILDR
ncbi:hypothetical protein CLUG_00745 [Clavispora lusitaniae ATCC 42720]|uniref:Orc1-like AAA ATPase domain-containing protein n=1 Tax=Clavispora lusitaniae (strain ATCC 42720) TaxID=306902 RepID=C4XXS3_CLAL4|nr:uncharacterized protein CLUG_00745 [Clavispora lusitaniae ATCC 42720]EEQ36622.1 hypothetical protein CLUG_00745 [Clavispora lusitaniae ATCC 42720]